MDIEKQIIKLGSKKRAKEALRFFKSGPGEYGEGDIFLGIRTPVLRALAKEQAFISLPETRKLIRSPYHEVRFVGLLIVIHKFREADSANAQKKIYDFYCRHFKYINNWDLVDVSSPYVVGAFLIDRDRSILYQWAGSKHLWTRRIAVIANLYFIRNNDLSDVFPLSEMLLDDSQDLIHKAVGWILREAGKRDRPALERFLKKNRGKMPRTMLRYAIEKFPETKRKQYLKPVREKN